MPLLRVSHIPGERALQRYVLVLVGWVVVSLIVIIGVRPPDLLDFRRAAAADDRGGRRGGVALALVIVVEVFVAYGV